MNNANSDWTPEVKARMFRAGITGKALAEKMGVTDCYLSAVLHGKKGRREKTKERVLEALTQLENNH